MIIPGVVPSNRACVHDEPDDKNLGCEGASMVFLLIFVVVGLVGWSIV